jgi:hypothetical protein
LLDASAFPLDGRRPDGFAASGFAAAAFEAAAALGADLAAAGDFNGFDGALCDVSGGAFPGGLVAFLPDLSAGARRVFEGGFFADVFDWARATFAEDGLGDFLRVFLDIRLPFVAFGGSIMGVLRVSSRQAGIASAAGQD